MGKLGPNWRRPYWIIKITGKGSYKLKEMDGKPRRRTGMWHTSKASTSEEKNYSTSFPMHALRIYFILFLLTFLDDMH